MHTAWPVRRTTLNDEFEYAATETRATVDGAMAAGHVHLLAGSMQDTKSHPRARTFMTHDSNDFSRALARENSHSSHSSPTTKSAVNN